MQLVRKISNLITKEDHQGFTVIIIITGVIFLKPPSRGVYRSLSTASYEIDC